MLVAATLALVLAAEPISPSEAPPEPASTPKVAQKTPAEPPAETPAAPPDWSFGFDRVDIFGRPDPGWKLHFKLGNFF